MEWYATSLESTHDEVSRIITIDILPKDVLEYIFLLLFPRDCEALQNASLVCLKWRKLTLEASKKGHQHFVLFAEFLEGSNVSSKITIPVRNLLATDPILTARSIPGVMRSYQIMSEGVFFILDQFAKELSETLKPSEALRVPNILRTQALRICALHREEKAAHSQLDEKIKWRALCMVSEMYRNHGRYSKAIAVAPKNCPAMMHRIVADLEMTGTYILKFLDTNNENISDVLRYLSDRYLKKKAIKKAIETAEFIPDPSSKGLMMVKIYVAQGDLEQAKERAFTIIDPEMRENAFAAICMALSRNGESDEALSKALLFLSEGYRLAEVLALIASDLIKVGDLSAALKVVEYIPVDDRFDNLDDIAVASGVRGEWELYNTTMEKIREHYSDSYDIDTIKKNIEDQIKTQSLWDLADEYLASDEYDDAIETANFIPNSDRRNGMLAKIYAKKGEIPKAQEFAASIENTEDRNRAYKVIALALAAKGKKDEAVKIAHSMQYIRQNQVLLFKICMTLFNEGHFEDALEVADQLGYDAEGLRKCSKLNALLYIALETGIDGESEKFSKVMEILSKMIVKTRFWTIKKDIDSMVANKLRFADLRYHLTDAGAALVAKIVA